jgi:hypothetical protein
VERVVLQEDRNYFVPIESYERFSDPKECKRRRWSFPLRGILIKMLYFRRRRTGLGDGCFEKRGVGNTTRK